MSMMPAAGSLVLGLALAGFFAVSDVHVLSFSAFHNVMVTRLRLTRYDDLAGTMSLSRLCFTRL